MVSQPHLSELELLMLTTPDDTEEASWMVMPDFQWRVVSLLVSILHLHASRRGLRWYLMPELKVTMPRAITPRIGTKRTLDVAPDLLMAEADDVERTSWNVMEEGQPPRFVLEVVTRESWERDTVEKWGIYNAMGVDEYAIFAPKRTDGGPLLFGHRRDADGDFESWDPDAQGVLWSEALGGLGLYVEDARWLRVRDAAGQRLPSAEEEAARADQAEARADQAEARTQQEGMARRAAEQELARLRALLERGGESPLP